MAFVLHFIERDLQRLDSTLSMVHLLNLPLASVKLSIPPLMTSVDQLSLLRVPKDVTWMGH